MILMRVFCLAMAKLVLAAIGLVIVPILLPFRKIDESTRLASGWVFSNIPGWFGNPFDGLYGDKYGRWIGICKASGRDPYGYLSMWLWCAIRNPVNKWSRLVAGCDVYRCTVKKIWGDDIVVEEPGVGGCQYLVATRNDGKKFPRLFVVVPWFFKKDKAILIDIGWKIKLSHNGVFSDSPPSEKYKGIVFTVSPWKTLA